MAAHPLLPELWNGLQRSAGQPQLMRLAYAVLVQAIAKTISESGPDMWAEARALNAADGQGEGSHDKSPHPPPQPNLNRKINAIDVSQPIYAQRARTESARLADMGSTNICEHASSRTAS